MSRRPIGRVERSRQVIAGGDTFVIRNSGGKTSEGGLCGPQEFGPRTDHAEGRERAVVAQGLSGVWGLPGRPCRDSPGELGLVMTPNGSILCGEQLTSY